jgi:hypothetical protein
LGAPQHLFSRSGNTARSDQWISLLVRYDNTEHVKFLAFLVFSFRIHDYAIGAL